MKNYKKDFENFWYYYKNYVLAITILIIASISYYFYAIYEPENDGSITIIAQPAFYDVSDYIGETWCQFADDFNNDGQVYIKVIPIQSDPNGDYGVSSNLQELTIMSITSHINSNKNSLFLLDETNYLLLKELGVNFTDLSPYSTNLEFDNELYPLNDTKLFDSIGSIRIMQHMYLALVDNSSNNYDISLLTSLINVDN